MGLPSRKRAAVKPFRGSVSIRLSQITKCEGHCLRLFLYAETTDNGNNLERTARRDGRNLKILATEPLLALVLIVVFLFVDDSFKTPTRA